jgi:hypothetical protein
MALSVGCLRAGKDEDNMEEDAGEAGSDIEDDDDDDDGNTRPPPPPPPPPPQVRRTLLACLCSVTLPLTHVEAEGRPRRRC